MKTTKSFSNGELHLHQKVFILSKVKDTHLLKTAADGELKEVYRLTS